MFKGFAAQWTPVRPSREVGSTPVSVRLAGEMLVVFRDAQGVAHTLLDRCAHRGAALSLGKVTAKGCLECPFHGWQYDGDGACKRVPLNVIPPEREGKRVVPSLPTREVGSLVWVFTGVDSQGVEPIAPPALLDPQWTLYVHHEVWNAHWTRAMENMLDSPHLPFVHRRTIGRAMRKRMKDDSVLTMEVLPESWGSRIRGTLDDSETGAELEWRKPNGMVLDIKIPEKGMRIHIFCVPEDDRHTRMILVAGRTFFKNPLGAFMDLYNRRILLEDRAVVESQRPPEVPPAAEELSVPSDSPTLYFRKWYFRELRESEASVPSPTSPRGHPDRPDEPRPRHIPREERDAHDSHATPEGEANTAPPPDDAQPATDVGAASSRTE